MLEGAPLWDVIDACSVIDIEACFDPIFEPPLDFLEECRKRQEAAQSPFHTTIERKIGKYGNFPEYAGSYHHAG